jgi:hypothetical protein
MNETEILRKKYKPEIIDILLVGESKPARGNFFYDVTSYDPLRGFTMEALTQIYPQIAGYSAEEFLRFFKEQGFFLDDLCHTPVNKMSPEERKEQRELGIGELKKSLEIYNPKIIVVIMLGIKGYVDTAISLAKLTRHAKTYYLPYPSPRYPAHQRNYINKLIGLLSILQ